MLSRSSGIIFYNKKIKDNDLYIRILNSNDEVDSGMVYGGNSSKKKLIYQNGYFVDYSFTKKNINFPPTFLAEISKPYIGNIFNDKYKMSALLSILSLINLSIIEGQNIKGLYKGIHNLINEIIIEDHWISFYCQWLFKLLKTIGYEIDYKNNIDKRYYNIIRQDFFKTYGNNNIEFPHYVFAKTPLINYKNIRTIFNIFESVFLKNHLDNDNHKMPINYTNFKKIILNRLK